MKLSKTKIFDISRVNGKISTSDLLEKYGFIKKISSGLYVQMHLMKKIVNNIENVIKSELDSIGCMEISLNQIQSSDMWKITGRYDTYGTEMFKLSDRWS